MGTLGVSIRCKDKSFSMKIPTALIAIISIALCSAQSHAQDASSKLTSDLRGDMNKCVSFKLHETHNLGSRMEYWGEVINTCHAPVVEGKIYIIEKKTAQTFDAIDVSIVKIESFYNLGSGDRTLIHGKVFKTYENSKIEFKLGGL
jgi:hypothetical protein